MRTQKTYRKREARPSDDYAKKSTRKVVEKTIRNTAEKKYKDDTFEGQLNSATNQEVVEPINIVTLGDNNSDRNGRKTEGVYVRVKGHFHVADLNQTVNPFNHVRLCIVEDKQPEGVVPNITTIFGSTSPNEMKSEFQRERFRILRSKDICLIGQYDSTGTQAQYITDAGMAVVDEYVSINKLETKYRNSNTGSIGDVLNGVIYLVLTTDNVYKSTACYFQMKTRYVYIDV